MHWCFQKGMKYGAASQLSAGGHSPLLFGALLPARVPESGSRTGILFPRPIPSPGSGVCMWACDFQAVKTPHPKATLIGSETDM